LNHDRPAVAGVGDRGELPAISVDTVALAEVVACGECVVRAVTVRRSLRALSFESTSSGVLLPTRARQ